MTALLDGLAKEFDGEMVGLEARFKTEDSLRDKIGRDLKEANLRLLEEMDKQRHLKDTEVRKARKESKKRWKERHKKQNPLKERRA